MWQLSHSKQIDTVEHVSDFSDLKNVIDYLSNILANKADPLWLEMYKSVN